MYKYFTLQRLTSLILFIFGSATVIAFILNSQNVSSEHVDFKFVLKHVVFVTDEEWGVNLSIESDLLLSADSICDANEKTHNLGVISGFKLLDGLPTNTTVALTYSDGIFRSTVGLPDEKETEISQCKSRKLRAEIKKQNKWHPVYLNDEFKFKTKLFSKNNSDDFENNKLRSIFTPVIIKDLSFFDSFEEVYTTNPIESKSQRSIREAGNVIEGEIYLPFYNKKIIIEEGQSVSLDIKRAHILKLSITKKGIEMRGVAELTAINRPDYSYLSGKESEKKDVNLLPTRWDYIYKSPWFNLLSIILATFIAVFGLFELYGLRTSVENDVN